MFNLGNRLFDPIRSVKQGDENQSRAPAGLINCGVGTDQCKIFRSPERFSFLAFRLLRFHQDGQLLQPVHGVGADSSNRLLSYSHPRIFTA